MISKFRPNRVTNAKTGQLLNNAGIYNFLSIKARDSIKVRIQHEVLPQSQHSRPGYNQSNDEISGTLSRYLISDIN